MTELAKDPRTVFCGYGLLTGKAMGTLKDIPRDQIIETPVAEGLMMSLSIGLSISGRLPVVYFERADFAMNAMDAIVNHLNAMEKLSDGEFKPAVIIRATVGNRSKPLYTGPVHTANPANAFRHLVDFPVIELQHLGDLSCSQVPGMVQQEYKAARERQLAGESSMIFEFKDGFQ